MENHRNLLKTLCRLCVNKIQLKHGYRAAKSITGYVAELLAFFGLNVNTQQDDTIYPQCLCTKCNQKLRRYKTKDKENCPAPGKYLPSADFYPHSKQCKICFMGEIGY